MDFSFLTGGSDGKKENNNLIWILAIVGIVFWLSKSRGLNLGGLLGGNNTVAYEEQPEEDNRKRRRR
ncbi:MAG: hypothetical protein Q8930_00995 [Bacillota bacterium]|nr:hypothetical protein [Bacillota bacterium]